MKVLKCNEPKLESQRSCNENEKEKERRYHPFKLMKPFFFSIRKKQRIPVGYTSNTEFSDVQEWGWLNPTGGAFSSVEDLAKVIARLIGQRFVKKRCQS